MVADTQKNHCSRHKEQGVISVVFALSLTLVITLIAVSLNTVYLANQKVRLTQAMEASIVAMGLAGHKVTDEAHDEIVTAQLAAFFPDTYQDIQVDKTTPSASGEPYSISAQYPSQFLMADWLLANQIHVGDSQLINSNMGVDIVRGNIDVALVLDNSGSMYGNIDFLRESARLFIDRLFDDRTDPDQVYISLIPFSNSVNLGKDRHHWFTRPLPNNADTHGVCPGYRFPVDPFWGEATELLDNALLLPQEELFPPVDDYIFSACGEAEITPLTNSQAAINDGINQLVADGSTDGDQGILWGWRSLSERWYDIWGAKRKQASPLSVKKVLVFFSDGSGITNENQIFLPACERIKQQGIDIYTIQFSTRNDSMETCASKVEGQQYFYYADDRQQLKQAFSDISESVGYALRLRSGG